MEASGGSIWGGYLNSRYDEGSPPTSKAFRRRLHRQIMSLFPFDRIALSPSVDEKYTVPSAATFNVDQGGLVFHLDRIPRGDSVIQRTGNSFVLTSVQYNLTISHNGVGGMVAYQYAFVWDCSPGAPAAVPPITDIIRLIAGWEGLSDVERDNSSRFRFLYHRRGILFPGTDLEGRYAHHAINFRVPILAIAECMSSDTDGLIPTRVRGALYFVAFSDSSPANPLSLRMRYRINFVDV